MTITSIDITIDESQLNWLFTFFNEQSRFVSDIISTFNAIQQDRIKYRTDLISRLTAASEYYQISHDPYVITKPAFIMRLSKGHIRENRSWKLITRLRHILTYLPKDWYSAVNQLCIAKKVADDQDPRKIFMSVFSNWRNWEFSDIARSYIYSKLFLADPIDKKKNSMQIISTSNISSFFLTVYTPAS